MQPLQRLFDNQKFLKNDPEYLTADKHYCIGSLCIQQPYKKVSHCLTVTVLIGLKVLKRGIFNRYKLDLPLNAFFNDNYYLHFLRVWLIPKDYNTVFVT